MSTQYGASFTFDGIKTTSYGVWVSGINTFAAPERDVETVAIPGRNGLLTLDNGRYQNVRIIYPCFMPVKFDTDFIFYKSAMLARAGFRRLVDTYHPEGFRVARLVGGFNPKTGILNRSAHFDVQFDCQPQFYLNSGQTERIFYEGTTFENPTPFRAKPLISVEFASAPRTGTVTIGDETVTITAAPASPIYLDCELQRAYYFVNGTKTPADSYVTLTTGNFPTIPPEASVISFTGASSVGVKPRWWML